MGRSVYLREGSRRETEMTYLNVDDNAKTIKGQKRGYLTGILYLAPASSSGFNVCTSSTAGCRAACLNYSGRARAGTAIQDARVRRTRELFADRERFIQELSRDIERLVRRAKRQGMIPAVRVNGTSDLPWLALALAEKFPQVQFYDYTKHKRPWERVKGNYHLTFSWSGENLQESIEALRHGVNVAVPFDVPRGGKLPSVWQGYKVVDGDLSDLRFLDPRGVVVGLRVKSVNSERKNLGVVSGFVQPLVQIQALGRAA
jgi:hypothetical protein